MSAGMALEPQNEACIFHDAKWLKWGGVKNEYHPSMAEKLVASISTTQHLIGNCSMNYYMSMKYANLTTSQTKPTNSYG